MWGLSELWGFSRSLTHKRCSLCTASACHLERLEQNENTLGKSFHSNNTSGLSVSFAHSLGLLEAFSEATQRTRLSAEVDAFNVWRDVGKCRFGVEDMVNVRVCLRDSYQVWGGGTHLPSPSPTEAKLKPFVLWVSQKQDANAGRSWKILINNN